MTPKSKQVDSGAQAKILLVDDHPIVRQGLAELIEQEPDLSVCGEAETAPEALEAIVTMKPDIAIVDVSLPDASGVELIKEIKAGHADVPVLVLSMHDETLYAERVLRAGAKGYIMKEEATETVMVAIRKVLNGHIYLSERMAGRLLSRFVEGTPETGGSPMQRLSDRELEVFELVGRGLSTRRIAEKLHLSIKTIESHREHIKEKLKLGSSRELLRHAMQWLEFKKPT